MHMLEQHQGKDHVSAQDQADENMAGSGSGVYLAEYKGEYMEVSMESANQLTVSAGALWVNGRFCIVDPAETLTVDNGSSGMTEYDLVCVHWKETTATQQVALAEGGTKEVSTTVEETELVIVKGDPASSGATDPEISQTTIRAGVGEAWVPFARITKDGLTPSVAFIVDKLVPESKFRDSISHQTYVIDKTSIEANGAYNLTNREWPVPFVDLWGVWAQVTNARVQVEIRNATNTGFDVGIRNVTNANASFDNEKISIHGLGLI